MKDIRPLDQLGFDALYETFSKAFEEYEVQVNPSELRVMLTRRGFDQHLSFGAFDDGRLVSFTFNGIGMYNGSKTAYDTGTGTLASHRGTGLASAVFNESIPFLKEAGVTQYLLEVLQHNTGAISVYKQLGFEVSREFSYFVQACDSIPQAERLLPDGLTMTEERFVNPERYAEMWDFTPSWQNSFEAIQRCIDDFTVLEVLHDQRLVGYAIFEPTSGDITQIAVDRSYRRQGIASALLAEMLKRNRHTAIKAVNAELSCNAIAAFLESNGIPMKGKQYEMIKKL